MAGQVRRAAILKAHPEVRKLMGHCVYTKYQVAAAVMFQIGCAAAAAAYLPWTQLVLTAYLLGGTVSCNLQLAMHEICHNLAFSPSTKLGRASNRVLSIVANLPLGIPAAIAFRKYHIDHHTYQGSDQIDTDIPCEWEGWFFTSPARKFLWALLMPAFYAIRPLFTHPKPVSSWEVTNIAVQLLFDAAIWAVFGPKALAYMLCGTLLGMGFHPTAFHFISEHCVFEEPYETYSYYGPLNMVMYNVGYHNEHHDFPNIPGSRLAQVKEIAPEFYNQLPCHHSWFKVYWDFVFHTDICPYSRIKRNPLKSNTAAAKAIANPEVWSGPPRTIKSRTAADTGSFLGLTWMLALAHLPRVTEAAANDAIYGLEMR